MKKIIILLLTTILFFNSCSQESEELDFPCGITGFEGTILIGIKDSNGVDLLDESNENSYNLDSLKLYLFYHGNKRLIHDWTNHMSLTKRDDYRLYLGLLANDFGENAKAIIEINNKEEIIITESGIESLECKKAVISKLWVNDSLFVDENEYPSRSIKIDLVR